MTDVRVSELRGEREGAELTLEARGLTRAFGDVVALRDCSFRLEGAGVWALVGSNGAGKTTLLRLLCGALGASAGGVWACGEEVYPESRARRLLGFAPELSLYAQELTVAEHLAQMAALRGLGARAAGVAEAMAACDLEPWARRRVPALSRGTRQRLSVACALLGAPPVLLLDEPSASLDPEQRASLASLLGALGRRRLVLLSTHDLELAALLDAPRLWLEGGRLRGGGEGARG